MPDEKIIADLERELAEERDELDRVKRANPMTLLPNTLPLALKAMHRSRIDQLEEDLADARAELARSTRERQQGAADRAADANERIALASEAAASSSAAAARWAKWAAFFTAIAAVATLAQAIMRK